MSGNTAMGLVLAGIYAVIAIALFAAGHLLFSDDAPAQVLKGRVILEQVAVAPAMLLLTFTGLIDWVMTTFPWMNNYLVLFGMSLAIAFLLGWGTSTLNRLGERLSSGRDAE